MRYASVFACVVVVVLGGVAAGQVHEGPLPKGLKPVFEWSFDGRGGGWEGFRETKNTSGGSAGAVRAPKSLTLSQPLSGCRFGLPDRVVRNYDHSRLPLGRYFSFAYYVEGVPRIRVIFLNATQHKLMSVVIPAKQKAWTQVWFNLLDVAGGEPLPTQAHVGDRLTQATIRGEVTDKTQVMILDNICVSEQRQGSFETPPRRVLPAQVFNRVPITLVLKEPAVVRFGDVTLPRWPGGTRVAATWLNDAPTQPDTSLWLAKALAKHGWKGTWLLRGNYPEAVKMIPELRKLGMEIGALPRSAYNFNGLSYAECLDEAMMARLSLEPHLKGQPLLAFEAPDSSRRVGYGPFWQGTFGMRGVRDAGFLVQNVWGKYCYLGWLRPPWPKWGGDISDAMIQQYIRRPGPGEAISKFPGRPHEHYGWEENYSQPLTGAREIYGKISEFGNARDKMPQKIARMLDYIEKWDLGKLLVLKTQAIPGGSRAVCEQVLADYAGREDFWYATLGEIGTYEYLRVHSRVVPVTKGPAKQIELAVEMADVNPRYVRQALTVRLPDTLKAAKVLVEGKAVLLRKDGTFDVPLKWLLRQPLKAELLVEPRIVWSPDVAYMALLVTNTSAGEQVVQGADLLGCGPASWRVTSGLAVPDPARYPMTLKPGQAATLLGRRGEVFRTSRQCRSGVWPVVARLKVKTPWGVQYQYVSTEIVVAPRLFVKMQPWLPLFIQPKGRVKVRVYLSRDTMSDPLRYGCFGGKKLRRFIRPPVRGKGMLRVEARPGFKVTPSEVALDLPQKGSAKLDFIIENTGDLPDPQEPFVFKPEITLDRIGPVPYAADPVRVYVDPQLAYKPLDDRGLVLQASFDGNAKPRTVLDPKQAGQRWGPVVLRRPGRGRGGKGTPHFVPGKKGQALGNASAWYGVEKNFSPLEGSILFWSKLPKGAGKRRQNVVLIGGGLTGSWYTLYVRHEKGKLHASYVSLGPEGHHVATDWADDDRWRHVAVTWDFFTKSLRLYVDGKLVGEDKDAKKEWLMMPFQFGRQMRTFPGWKDYYKGEYGGTPPGGGYSFKFGQVALSGGLGPRPAVSHMDELYVFDRALTAKEIEQHIADGK